MFANAAIRRRSPPRLEINEGQRTQLPLLGRRDPLLYHVTFDLDPADSAILSTPSGVVVNQYSWTVDVAAASRCPEGIGAAFRAPTPPPPGAANDCTPPPVPGQDDLVINEVRSTGVVDFIELKNPGGATVDTLRLEAARQRPDPQLCHPGRHHDRQRRIHRGRGRTRTLPSHLTFGLGSADSAVLSTPYDVLADSRAWTVHVNTASRCADGTGAFLAGTTATPGAINSCP